MSEYENKMSHLISPSITFGGDDADTMILHYYNAMNAIQDALQMMQKTFHGRNHYSLTKEEQNEAAMQFEDRMERLRSVYRELDWLQEEVYKKANP